MIRSQLTLKKISKTKIYKAYFLPKATRRNYKHGYTKYSKEKNR